MAARVGLLTLGCQVFVILSLIHLLAGESNDTDPRWDKYLKKIDEALKNYEPPTADDCSVYLDQLDRDLKVWQGGITQEQFEITKDRGVHYQIFNHKLYREDRTMFGPRSEGVEHFILEIIDRLPDMEMKINVRDYPQSPKQLPPRPIFSFSKPERENHDIMYPAWTFWAGGPAVWPLYPTGLGRWDLQREIIAKEAKKWPWQKKYSKGFFRGSRTSSERDPLVLLSREQPELVDAQYTKNQAWKSDKDTLGYPPAKEIELKYHCDHKYLFNFRGVAASFRYKHLFVCKSAVFHVGEDWLEFFYSALKPWVHYIPVKQDLSDVRELLEFALANDGVLEQIAERGHDFIWNHLRNSDVSCYWEHLLKRYANLMKWKPMRNKAYQEIKAKRVKDEF